VRWFLSALLALALPVAAHAQSDSRKVAVFVNNGGGSGTLAHNSIGNNANSNWKGVGAATQVIYTALDQMGVPYQTFACNDSGRWGPDLTTEKGKADSTWFREQGYMGVLYANHRLNSSSGSDEAWKYFSDGTNRGTQAGSFLSGLWGIPCVVIGVERIDTGSSGSIKNGVGGYTTSPTGAASAWSGNSQPVEAQQRGAFANGDTLITFGRGHYMAADQSADYTVLIYGGDSIPGSPLGAGAFAKAWRYKNSCYYYYAATTPQENPVPILLGISQLFTDAGYTPRRKLNIHLTIDHSVPYITPSHAGTDTLYKYLAAMNARPAAPLLTGATERKYRNLQADSIGTPASNWYTRHRKQLAGYHPHPHQIGYGRFMSGDDWDVTAWTDTATQRQRYNFQERAITDTLKLPRAAGYEKNYLVPGGTGGGNSDLHAYIFIENGYKAIRSNYAANEAADSNGVGSQTQNRRIMTPATATDYDQERLRPWLLGAGSGGSARKTGQIWVITPLQILGGGDTTWTETAELDNGIRYYGTQHSFIRLVFQGALYNNDVYWHELQSIGPDDLLRPSMRQLLYLKNRMNNIIKMEPYFQPLVPRRHNVARS